MRIKRILLTLSLLILLSLPISGVALAGEDVTFTWDSYTDTEPVVGFKLYMATAPSVAVIPTNLVATIPGKATTTYKQTGVLSGNKYWVLTAYTASFESGPSNEVSYNVKLKPPSGLGSKVVISFGSVTVTVAAK